MQEFNEGDLVEAVKGERVVRGRVKYSDWVHTLYLDAGERLVLDYLAGTLGYTLTVIEKATPPLPTEPGWYESEEFPLGTSADYEPYSLNTDGEWFTADGQLLTPTDLRELGDLRRLEPVPVTAKRVLDAVRRVAEERAGNPWNAGVTINAVAADFGVTE